MIKLPYSETLTYHEGLNQYDVLENKAHKIRLQFLYYAVQEKEYVCLNLSTVAPLLKMQFHPLDAGYRFTVRALDWNRPLEASCTLAGLRRKLEPVNIVQSIPAEILPAISYPANVNFVTA